MGRQGVTCTLSGSASSSKEEWELHVGRMKTDGGDRGLHIT